MTSVPCAAQAANSQAVAGGGLAPSPTSNLHPFDPEHLIVNGLGGAFLHPTHVFAPARFASVPDPHADELFEQSLSPRGRSPRGGSPQRGVPATRQVPLSGHEQARQLCRCASSSLLYPLFEKYDLQAALSAMSTSDRRWQEISVRCSARQCSSCCLAQKQSTGLAATDFYPQMCVMGIVLNVRPWLQGSCPLIK